MKYERLKKRLIKKVMMLGGLMVGAALIFFLLSIQESSLEQELKKTKDDATSLSAQATSSDQQNKEMVEALAIYKDLTEDKTANDELANISPRIRTARTLKENLSDKFKLDLSNIDFTKIEDISQYAQSRLVKVYSNNIVMEFSALTDEIILSFCHSMVKEAPGYINIESIELDKTGELTGEVLQKIRSNDGELPALVKAKVVFNWITIGNLNPTSVKDENNTKI